LGHFQRKHRRAHTAISRVGSDVERERGLAHARPAGDDDKIRGLQTGGDLVQVLVTGRHAGDHFLALVELVDGFERVGDHVADGDEGRFDFLLGDVKDYFFGAVEEFFDVALLFVTARRNLRGGGDQAAQNGLLAHDARVVRDVRGGGHEVVQRSQIGGAPDGFQLAVVLQDIRQRDNIHRLVAVAELDHGAKNLAVALAVKILGPEHLEHVVDRFVVEQNAAQHRRLGFEILRRNFAEVVFQGGHRRSKRGGGKRSRRAQIFCYARVKESRSKSKKNIRARKSFFAGAARKILPGKRAGEQTSNQAAPFAPSAHSLRTLYTQRAARHEKIPGRVQAPPWLAVTVVWMPPRTLKSPITVILRGRQACTRSSRILLITAS